MDAALIFSAKDGRQSRLLHELKEKQQQLVQASKLASMGELSSGIAHELNNPLFAVSGLTEVMQRKLQKDHPEAYESVAKSFDTMLIATEKMRKIINHIRIFARQEQMKFVKHPLNDIIESGLLLIHEQLRIKNIRVETDMTSTESLMLYCAPNRLEQVILNLFSNARDAIESKQQHVEDHKGIISISTVLQNNDVLIHFQDNGIGLEEDTYAKIYDPFFSTKEIGKGTGLGLSISYGILKEHQATIQCISKINDYTKFTIRLPIHDPMMMD
jgi:histidine kinase